jgi:hypothetical protein
MDDGVIGRWVAMVVVFYVGEVEKCVVALNKDNGLRSKRWGFETNTVDGSRCRDTRKKM